MAVELLFPFNSIIFFIPYVLYGGYITIFSIFVGLTSEDRTHEYQKSMILKYASIINILVVISLLFVPFGFRTSGSIPSDVRTLLYLLTFILPSILAFVPRIFTFGFAFLIFGNKNRDDFGKYLTYTGIFWLIYSVWASFSLLSPISNIPQLAFVLDYSFNIFPEYELLIVFLQLLSMGSIFGVLGGIALLMHSFKHNDRNLKIAGFIYLVGIAILSLGVIPQYIDLLL